MIEVIPLPFNNNRRKIGVDCMYKAITDNRIAKLESNTAEVLVEVFHKGIREAEKLVEAANLGGFIRKHPIALHDSPYDFAIEILTMIKDYESIEQYS